MFNYFYNSNIFIWIEKIINFINSIFFALLIAGLYFALIFNNIKSILTLLNSYDVKKKFINLELKKFLYLYNLTNHNKELIKTFEKN